MNLHFGATTHVACRVTPGALRHSSGSFTIGKRFGVRRHREWNLARATVERSAAERIVDGMAPRSGADHARDDAFGFA